MDTVENWYDNVYDEWSRLDKHKIEFEITKGDGFTTAYFSSPNEVRSLMSDFDIHELVFAGVENILGCKEKELYSLNKEQYNKWIEVCLQLSTDENLIGTSQHFLYIGQKT